MKAFDYNSLFTKAKLYTQRANEVDRESDLYPFWLSLALEFVIRSTLAKIHPVLLAEVKNDHTNLLYAFNIEGRTTNTPKSISISDALIRVSDIIPEFSKDYAAKAKKIIEERNTELHSGEVGFANFPANVWISDYYRIVSILLKHQTRNLNDLLGDDEAKAAFIMIDDDDANLKKKVINKLNSHKTVFEGLDETERLAKVEHANKEYQKLRSHIKIITCPACNNKGIVTGEIISTSSPKINESELVEEIRYLPSKFFCFCCGFKVEGFNKLKYINATSVFTKISHIDPVEYLGIDPEEYIDVNELVEERIRDMYLEAQYNDE